MGNLNGGDHIGKYSKGAKFENDVIKKLIKLGAYCIRSAGSKGIVDIVAFIKYFDDVTFTYFIQCKYGKALMGKRDKKKLIELSKEYNAIPIYIFRKKYEKSINLDFISWGKTFKIKNISDIIISKIWRKQK